MPTFLEYKGLSTLLEYKGLFKFLEYKRVSTFLEYKGLSTFLNTRDCLIFYIIWGIVHFFRKQGIVQFSKIWFKNKTRQLVRKLFLCMVSQQMTMTHNFSEIPKLLYTVGLAKPNFSQLWCPSHNTVLHGTVPQILKWNICW